MVRLVVVLLNLVKLQLNVKLNANEKLFFIFEKVKETILDFLHGPVRVLRFYCALIKFMNRPGL